MRTARRCRRSDVVDGRDDAHGAWLRAVGRVGSVERRPPTASPGALTHDPGRSERSWGSDSLLPPFTVRLCREGSGWKQHLGVMRGPGYDEHRYPERSANGLRLYLCSFAPSTDGALMASDWGDALRFVVHASKNGERISAVVLRSTLPAGRWLRLPANEPPASPIMPPCAKVAELVDALDLGSSAARRGGSSPPFRTTDPAGGRAVRGYVPPGGRRLANPERGTGLSLPALCWRRCPLSAKLQGCGGIVRPRPRLQNPFHSHQCRGPRHRWQESTCKLRSNPPAIWNAA